MLGIYTGAIGVLGVVFLAVVDGSLHPSLGRRVEHQVGMDLRRIPGIYGVVSDVSFEYLNVDHVVLTREGRLAVEVKSSFSRRQELAQVHDRKVTQARDGAKRVARLLRSRGIDIPVEPVLLFTGPGAPFMPPIVQHGDVTIASSADHTVSALAGRGPRLDRESAARAASALLAYRDERTDYERSRSLRGRRSPSRR